MGRLVGCLFEQLGEENVRNRLKSAGWSDDRINEARDIDIDAAMRGELSTREVALYRSKLNALALSDMKSELGVVLGKATNDKERAKLAARWFANLLTPDTKRGGLSTRPSVDQLRGGYLNLAFAALTDLTEAIKPNSMLPSAFRDRGLKKLNRDIAKYLHGDKTAVDGEMAQMLDKWLDVADGLRQRANALGADIPKLEGWGVRHSWSSTKVSKLTREEFVEDIISSGVLDAQRMAGEGNPPMTEGQLRVAVAEVYDNIVTRGGATRQPTMVDIPGIVAKRHGEERQLHFKDGDAWFETARKYSEGQEDDMLLRAMYHYVEDLAGDIALMERLGPSAAQNLRYVSDLVDVAGDGAETGSIRRTLDTFKSMARQDRSLNGWLASAGASLRSYQVFTKLPMAFLSSLSDFGFTATTARQYGASMSKILGNYSKLMSGMSPAELQNMGLTADFLSRTINRTTRYGDKFGAGAMGRLADFTMKASLLERHTLFGQLAFQMEINRVLGANVGKKLDELPDKWPEFFKHYGLDEADWEALQRTRTSEGMLDPTKIEDHMQAARVLGAFQQEVRYAFFEPNARERVMLQGGTQAGTLAGEIMRSVTMFKSFPVGIMVLHWGRMAGMSSGKDKLTYAASLIATTTMLGAMSITAKEMAKGRTPPDFSDPRMFLRAFMQGGSGGLLVDVLGREHRSAATLVADLAGPVISDLAAAVVTMQKVAKLGIEEDPGAAAAKLSSDAIELIQKSIPGANLWYARALITNRAFDMINKEVDPLYWEKREGLEGWLLQRNQQITY